MPTAELSAVPNTYQVCTRCIIDTTDPEITFDENGVCNHCLRFDHEISPLWFPNEEGAKMWESQAAAIRRDGEGKDFDCILGLSGGIDSSYLAIKLHEAGLRPLVVHVDAGWNSELAVNNIERVVDYCDYELHTDVLDWESVRDLQLAYLKSGVANLDVVQDHGFFASLYRFAIDADIKYVMNGGNIATESVFPRSWHHSPMDEINLKAIHRRYGEASLDRFPTVSFFEYYIQFPYIKKMRVIRPLNFMPYVKSEAKQLLINEVGYKDYGGKHGESVFTKFFQEYFLPLKYGYDKRRPHLSCLILSGQMTREEALAELDKPRYDDDQLRRDRDYIAKKLRITVEELDSYTEGPARTYRDFANWDRRYNALKSMQKLAGRIGKGDLNRYS